MIHCPFKKDDCKNKKKHPKVNDEYVKRQCWFYFIDLCQEGSAYEL